ncbi:MAG: hypothetical protein KatS3mg022_2804 [Armatimonadota bacterium]|nr:MAG: hypothetical protein KatS3mg022_2804 [Armatimonadota bacterium]
MSIACSWYIGVDSEEWRARFLPVLRKRRVSATILPKAESLLTMAINPLQGYVIETADNVTRSLGIATCLFRKWWVEGFGFPTIALLTSREIWETKAQFSGLLPVSSTPVPLFALVVHKELVDQPFPQAGLSFLSRLKYIDVRVRDLYHICKRSSHSELLHQLASKCRLDFSVWEPKFLVDGSIVVIEGEDIGDFITTSYRAIWREGLWRKPLGLVALAPEPLHTDLLHAQIEERPLFMDVCSPEQLAVEGIARVRRWRSSVELALQEFYEQWQNVD